MISTILFRYRIFVLFVAFFLPLLSSARGELTSEDSGGEGKSSNQIFVVDMQKVIDGSILGKAAKNNIQAETKKAENAIFPLREEIEKSKADIVKQKKVLSEKALEERQEKVAKKERELDRVLADKREELGRKNEAEMKSLIDQIDEVLKDLGKSGKYPVIIENDRRYVIYSDEKLDLTKLVIDQLNKKKIDL